MTGSPGARSWTPGPTSSTTPDPSSPSTMGTGTPVQLPSAAWRQLWQTPLATIRTRTSPSRGGASSRSSTDSGLPCSKSTEARIRSSRGPPLPRSAGSYSTGTGLRPSAIMAGVIGRLLGATGVEVPVVGQGTWKMGEDRRAQRAEVAALRLGIELGLTHIDTAEMYADGGAESVVGAAVAGQRDR